MSLYDDPLITYDGAAACARGPLIFIRPKYKGDLGILEHERVHRKQWLRTLSLHSWLYLFVPEYRLACEVEAYKEQAKWYQDDRLPKFAGFISRNYGLKITEEAALKLLADR
jgi:hypothetical protein